MPQPGYTRNSLRRGGATCQEGLSVNVCGFRGSSLSHPALWLDESKMITLVCVQSTLRKSSLQLNKQAAILNEDSLWQVHRAL